MDFAEIISQSLAHYSEKRLEAVASKLFRPRIGQPRDELIERINETQKNSPVVDRLLKTLPAAPRMLLSLLGRTRQSRWRIDDLLTLLSALGWTDGFPILGSLLEHGVAVAVGDSRSIGDFNEWYESQGGKAFVIVPPTILARAASEPYRLTADQKDRKTVIGPSAVAVSGDGLDWILRLAAARQRVRISPVKLTHSGSHYKRDQIRFSTDPALLSPLEHSPVPADAGTLALTWAMCAGLTTDEGELKAVEPPPDWSGSITDVLTDLYAALFALRDWDPLEGCISGGGPSSTNTVGVLLAALLAEAPKDYHSAEELAAWLWDHHPHWSGQIKFKDGAKGGAAWVEAHLSATFVPLRIAESTNGNSGMAFRLTEFGRFLLADGPAPVTIEVPAQTLLVQPNGEILAYRQGLTPGLVEQLSRFAEWKQIGGACTLDLTEASVTRGLEDGFSLASILQALNRHGLKPVPENVADLLHRWADKRERLAVYRSATLVEFSSEMDLDIAMARGIVTVRLTGRIGITATGTAPEFKFLRLIGNRDYEAAPAMCVVAEDDGITLRVDAAAADLLLEAEIARFAEPVPGHNGDARRYRMSPQSLRHAVAQGQCLADLEAWFFARSGEGLPAAAKLFLASPESTLLTSNHLLVLETPTSEIADGLMQWPNTAPFTFKRLGPNALAIHVDQLPALRQQLSALGLRVQGCG